MIDDGRDVLEQFDALMQQRSGTDRVRMMSEMFDLARTLVLSNLRAAHPEASPADLRVMLFERLYREDLDPVEYARTVAQLRTVAPPHPRTHRRTIAPSSPSHRQ